MRGFLIAALLLSAWNLGALPPAHSQESHLDELIANAVLPLPAPLKAGATVVSYDADMMRTVLRQGTNDLICVADGPGAGFSVLCQHKSVEAFSPTSQASHRNALCSRLLTVSTIRRNDSSRIKRTSPSSRGE